MDLKDKSILFAVPVLTGGGAERVVSVLASGLAEKGYKVSLLLNKRCEDEYSISPNVNVFSLPISLAKSGGVIHKIIKTVIRFKIIKDINPDVIIPFLHGVVEPTYICNVLLRKKFVDTIRISPQMDDVGNRIIRDFIISKSDACFLQTESQKEYFASRIQKKCFVVSNPISDIFISDIPHKSIRPRTIICVGRLTKQKNHMMAIKAVAQLRGEYNDIKLVIYGEGPEKNALEHYIYNNRLQESVFLKGRIMDIKSGYDNADIFILSSDFEGFPNALMEAMSCGIPCISTDCPTGPRDIITDGENGLLIPPKDEKALEDAIRKVIEDREFRYRISENAQKRIKTHYSTDVIVDKFVRELCIKV